ncbi:MAG: cyclase family protein [Proteobacteria bacterium]|nr:cyclase family protein [Pseudomonadota bacterium]
MLSEEFEIIDLGVFLDQAAYKPWGYSARHVTHAQGAKAMSSFLNLDEFRMSEKDVEKGDFPEALGLAWTHVNMTDHTGNHIDAPFHFGPMVEGRPAKTIDEVPLSWCFGPGVRLDFREFQGRDVGPGDIEDELVRSGAELTPGTIPLLWTGADAHIDDDDYWQSQAGLSPEGLGHFLDRGVKLIGIDGYAMDVSYNTMKRDQENGNPKPFPVHFVGRAREHMHLEKLANLGALPRPHGFLFAAFPIKLRKGSAGWVRPVALVPKSHFEGSINQDEPATFV